MAYIKADHSKLKSTASAVETYAELLEREIKTAKQDVQTPVSYTHLTLPTIA